MLSLSRGNTFEVQYCRQNWQPDGKPLRAPNSRTLLPRVSAFFVQGGNLPAVLSTHPRLNEVSAFLSYFCLLFSLKITKCEQAFKQKKEDFVSVAINDQHMAPGNVFVHHVCVTEVR